MEIRPNVKLLVIFILLCSIKFGFAVDKGVVNGKVFDNSSKEPLIGATIKVKGTEIGNVTDVEGRFELSGVPLGNQTLIISYIGYATTELTIKVQEGIAVNVNVPLAESTQQLNEIVIIAKPDVRFSPILNSTDFQLVNAIKNSDGIITGISNEQISRSIDRDASQIAQRISGVSLVDRFVVVRGLDTRYNMTLINGLVAPSSEEDKRAFSYDALPTGVIDRLELEKSPTPHLPAMWGGGVIKIFTRNFASARQLNVGFSGAYRSEGSSFNDNFLTYDGSSKDWLGNGAEDRRLPTILRQPYFNYPNFKQYPLENIAIARSASFRSYTPYNFSSNFDKRANISYYDTWKIGSAKLNNLTSASYTQERIFRSIKIATDNAQYGNNGGLPDTLRLSEGRFLTRFLPETEGVDSLYEEQVRLSAVQSLGLLINEDNNLSATIFYNRFGTDQVINRIATDNDFPDIRRKGFFYKYEKREIFLGQLGGSHKFNQHSLDWTVGASITKNDVPDLQQYFFEQNITDTTDMWRAPHGQIGASINYFQTHYIFETQERSFTAKVDYKNDFKNGISLRAGLFFDRKDREFFSYRYVINSEDDQLDQQNISKPWLIVDSLNSSQNFDLDKLYLSNPSGQGAYFFDDQSREGYVAANIPFFDKSLTFYGGARVANLRRILYDRFNLPTKDVALFEGELVKVPDQENTYILPSGVIKYSFPDKKFQLRAGYGQTVDRPQFREQTGASSVGNQGQTSSFFDFEENEIFEGNPVLKNSLLHHVDLRFEFYPSNKGDFIAIGGFYKYIEDPIQKFILSIRGDAGARRVNYQNAIDADIIGLEVEVRKSFEKVQIPLIKDMSLNFNASYIWSKARYANLNDTVTQRLQGTSPVLINTALYYEHEDSGTLLSAIYNLTWDRLRDYNPGGEGDLLEARRHQLDLVLKKRLTNFLELKAGIQNILNQPFRFYRDANENYTFDPQKDKILIPEGASQVNGDYSEEEYKIGSYYSLGFTFTIQ